jgi:hypothetical protein
MYCACGSGCTFFNHFNTNGTDETVSEDIDTEDDQDEEMLKTSAMMRKTV